MVQRLEEMVAKLEAGSLSLEDSLKAFEEGIRLVRQGEKLLTAGGEAIEQLLWTRRARTRRRRSTGGLKRGRRQRPTPWSPAGNRLPPDDDVPF